MALAWAGDATRVRRWAVWAVLAAVPLVVLCVADPDGPIGLLLPLAVEAVALVVFLVAAVRMPYARRVWWLLWASQLLIVVGDVVYAVQDATGGSAFPGWADPFYVLSYLPQAAAIFLVVRSRRPRTSRTQLIDSAIVLVPVMSLAAVYVIVPLARSGDATWATGLALLYPVLDLWLLGGVIRLSVANGGRRSRSVGLLTASIATTLAADLVFTGLQVGGLVEELPGWLSALFTAGVLLMTASAMVPDARRILVVDEPQNRAGWTRGRILALGLASMALPVTIVLGAGTGDDLDAVVLAGGAVVVNALVVRRGLLVLRVMNRQSEKLAELARSDPLTGLPNRRSWDYELKRAEEWVAETGKPITVAFLDLDHFKDYNDDNGHQSGDRLLVACAAAWADGLPSSAYLARYGGEEFTVLLPGIDAAHAAPILELLRTCTPEGTTVSIGYAERSTQETMLDVVADADAALYVAKQRGRDRVVGVAVASRTEPV